MTLQDPGAASQTTPLDPQQTPQLPFQPVEGRNVLALVALIVSIVGFIAACIPGVFVLGWILLPIAFILSIVSLFMKGSGKGLGIAGLIVSIVGTIVAFIVFFAVVAVAVNGAFSDETKSKQLQYQPFLTRLANSTFPCSRPAVPYLR